MRSVLAALALVGGCDFFFRLKPVDPYLKPDAVGIDYDGDGWFAEDNCPALYNPDQLDQDGDGVGNTCDPHLDEKDVIVVQELFDGDAPGWLANGSWTKTSAGWTSPRVTELGGTFSYQTPRTLHRPVIQVGFTMVDFDLSSDHANMELHLDAPGLIGDCAFRMDATQTPRSLLVIHVGGDNDGVHITPEFQKGNIYLGAYGRGADRSWCRSAANYHERNDDTAGNTFDTTPVIELSRMQVTLHHVTVYQVVP